MRSTIRAILPMVIATALVVPVISTTHAAQSPRQAPLQPVEQMVNRVRDSLKLNETQVGELRQLLIKRTPKLTELRNRARANPYAPGLQTELETEQTSLREEFGQFLNEDQKGKLSGVDLRQIVPLGPPVVAINILPRVRLEPGAVKLAAAERVIPAPALAKGRASRLTEEQKILHVLNRITFGPRPGDMARVKEMGIDRFIEEQLYSESIDDSDLVKRLEVLPTQRMASGELYQFYPPLRIAEQRANDKTAPSVLGRPQQILGELVQQKLVRAVSSNRQLQEVLIDFWYNHFNVFAQKEAVQWFVTSYERDVIRPRALGKFRDLLRAAAESPAMMFYLDNWLSASPDSRQPRPPAPIRPQNREPTEIAPAATTKPSEGGDSNSAMMGKTESGQNPQPAVRNPQSTPPPPRPPARKPGINENYARELMELHTLGVNGGYTQKDVQEVARCFTGWTIERPYQGGGFVYRPWMHDDGAKTVLGVTIAPGGGVTDGLRVIDILAAHPSTARFISKKLCQRFVADDPPAQLVERVSQVFIKTDGNIREVIRAILTSVEFNSPSAFRSKIKSPLELAASAIRAIDGDTNGAPALHEWIRRMGGPLYQFTFPTGYAEDSEIWVNTGVFFNRINYAVALANNQINGTRYDPLRLVASETAINVDAMSSQLSALIVHTELSAESLRAVRNGLNGPALDPATPRPAMDRGPAQQPVPAVAEANPERRRIALLVGLLLGTAEFQRR